MTTEHINTIIEGHELSVPAHLMPAEPVKTAHIAMPLTVGSGIHENRIFDADDYLVAECNGPDADKRAREIITACNAHDDLVSAAKLVMASFSYAPGKGPVWYEAARIALEKMGAA